MFLNSSLLASLRFFAAASRTSSFTQAALDLHVTQGAVSQQIKNLEDALGVQLFYRLTRKVALTEEGRRFAIIVKHALDDIEQGANAIAAVHSASDIRLRAGPSFSLRWLVPRLFDFYARHPGIQLSVNAAYGSFDSGNRDFDLAVEYIEGKLPGMHCEVLMEEQLVPVCSPEYLKKHAFLKKPKNLERCTLLHDEQPWPGAANDAEWRHWLDAVGAKSVPSRPGRFFSLSSMSIEAAVRNQGVAIGRASLIRELLEAKQLTMPFEQRIKSPTKYWLVHHKGAATRPGMQSVIRWLQEQAGN